MSVTRAAVETVLIRRTGKLLTAASLDGTTVDGLNDDLTDPLSEALRQLGYPASLTAPDVTQVADDEIGQLLDVAELRTLENIAGNLDLVDVKSGPEWEYLDQLRKGVEMRITRKRTANERAYGTGLGSLTAGVLTLDFQQHNDLTSDEEA